MFLNINPSNGIAIYDQVVRQVKFAVAQGAVKPGNLVPSVREMARELAINPNTVSAGLSTTSSRRRFRAGSRHGTRGRGRCREAVQK